jgi:hypothetical protein
MFLACSALSILYSIVIGPASEVTEGVFSPNPSFFYERAQLAPYELTHVRASPGDCAAGWAQAARKI